VSILADVLRETDRGLTANRVAARLGLPDELVAIALEHAERIGLVVRPGGSSCATGRCAVAERPVADRPAACFGCPFAR
jgi:hypothetical protein